jgi:N4-gp56 family major capsid protein
MFNDFDVQMENKTAVSTALMEMKDDDVQLGMLNEAGVRIYTDTATQLSEVGTGGAATAKINRAILRKATKTLKINMAKKNTYMVTGSTKFSTTPINAAYYAIIGPDTLTDLEDIAEWRPVHTYGYTKGLAKDEIGSLDETRFVESLRHMHYAGAGADVSGGNPGDLAVTGNNVDVHTVLYPTEGAYATVGLEGAGKIKFLSKPAGKASKEDPHGLTAIFSGNYFHGGIALQSEKLAVVYHAVSA